MTSLERYYFITHMRNCVMGAMSVFEIACFVAYDRFVFCTESNFSQSEKHTNHRATRADQEEGQGPTPHPRNSYVAIDFLRNYGTKPSRSMTSYYIYTTKAIPYSILFLRPFFLIHQRLTIRSFGRRDIGCYEIRKL